MWRWMLKKVKKYRNKLKTEKGFSLVELIIIMIILGISLVPLTTLIKTNQKGIGDITLSVQAEYFTQSVMEQIIADYTSSTRGYDWVINNWSGTTVTQNNLNIRAGISINERVDADTGLQVADIVVGVNLTNGFSISLACCIVDY